MMSCSYDDTSSLGYNLFVLLFAITFPVAVIALSYGKLFAYVHRCY